jgi:endonuclease YncB( thermonuclease family)
MFILASSAVFSDDMTERADIIDGDTLEIQGTRTRPWGIDAPESHQLRQRGR